MRTAARPYDRIIANVGAWDIPATCPTGRIVVPLRFATITGLLAFDRTPGQPGLDRQQLPPRLLRSHAGRRLARPILQPHQC